MTRGQEANHVYVTADRAAEVDHHAPPPPGTRATGPEDAALDVLAAALTRSGAQDAAHTARDQARTRAVEAARRAAEDAARRAAEPVVPAEHTARITQLTQRQTERDRLASEQQEHRRAADGARTELAGTSRLRPGRRRDLIEAITLHDQAVHATYPDARRLDREIDTLTRQVTDDTRTREAEQRGRASLRSPADEDFPEIQLSPAFPVELGPRRSRPHATVARAAAEQSRMDQDLRRIIERHHQRTIDHSRGRDDSPGIGTCTRPGPGRRIRDSAPDGHLHLGQPVAVSFRK